MEPLQLANVIRLAASQGLMLSAIVLSMTLAAILGAQLAPSPSWATLPVAAMVIGTAIASIPASMLMRRFGRRAGFLLGTTVGIAGSALATYGVATQSFALFVLGHLLVGAYQGFANYYRFAAVEAAGPGHAPRAVSFVVAGGVVAAFLGPQLAIWGRHWFAVEAYLGSYVAQGLLGLLAIVVLIGLRLPPVSVTHAEAARPLRELLAQPKLKVAVIGSATGYAVMIMAMTATPLAMLGCGLTPGDVKPVIQWHVLGMFAPSFFTGNLIKRRGAVRIMRAGFVLLALHVLVASAGNDFINFLSALILLGVGWNFAFIGGTALLTETYRPAEQLRVQAVNESSVFGLVAVSTLTAGWVYEQFGWVPLNQAVLPLLLAALVLTFSIEGWRRPAPRAA
jgi:MFS family permease